MAENDKNKPPEWWTSWQPDRAVEDGARCPFSYELLLDIACEAGINSDVALGDQDNLTPAQIERRLDEVLTKLLAILRRERAQEEGN